MSASNRSGSKFNGLIFIRSERFSSTSAAYEMNTHPAEHMDETVEVELSSSDIPHAYSTVLCTGCRAGDNISRESIDVGFIIFTVVNKRVIRKEVTDSTE